MEAEKEWVFPGCVYCTFLFPDYVFFPLKYGLFLNIRSSLVAQMAKNLPEMQETWVQSLGWEDPLEKGMATHSSILGWSIALDRQAWGASVHGVTKSPDRTEPFP